MSIILIAAMSTNRVIGCNGGLPRHLPEDLAHFKKLTSWHTVVMGYNTYVSIGRPLPQRYNIVLTRDESRDDPKVTVINDFDSFMETYTTALDEDLYIIGGAQIYQLFLPFADQIELTEIHREVDGDTFFPEFEKDFQEAKREEYDEFDFVTYVRKVSV